MSYNMSQATGENTYKGELLTFPTNQINVKWVGINILNSYNSANGYMGISEIKLIYHSYPKECALLEQI